MTNAQTAHPPNHQARVILGLDDGVDDVSTDKENADVEEVEDHAQLSSKLKLLVSHGNEHTHGDELGDEENSSPNLQSFLFVLSLLVDALEVSFVFLLHQNAPS